MAESSRVYVAGHRGLVGSAVWRHLEVRGFTNLVGRSSRELDLRDRDETTSFFEQVRPDVVICAAARVGGIMANAREPMRFLSDNLRIQTNVLDAAVAVGVERLLFLASSCIYPKHAEQPIREEALMTGPLEPTNEAYAIAKLAGIGHVSAVRKQTGRAFISAMPTNLYGPGDTFDESSGHVIPAMMRRFHLAKVRGDARVVCWGTGRPRREFLHVDDFAAACHLLLTRYDADVPINVGTGHDVSIGHLAELIAEVVGYEGDIHWDTDKPDGTPRKLLDVSRISALGWRPAIDLREGLRQTYRWYLGSGGAGDENDGATPTSAVTVRDARHG